MAGTTTLASLPFFSTKECEFSDVAVFMAGKNVAKFTEVSFGAKQDKDPLHASGDEPFGIQKGNRSYSGSISVLLGALNDMNDAVISAGGRDILDAEMDVVITYKAFNSRRLRTVTMVGVQFTEFMINWKQGDKSQSINLPIIFVRQILG